MTGYDLIRYIRAQDWPSTARHVAIMLAMRAGKEGCFPLVKTIAQDCGITPRAAGQWISWLEGGDPWKTKRREPINRPFLTSEIIEGLKHWTFHAPEQRSIGPEQRSPSADSAPEQRSIGPEQRSNQCEQRSNQCEQRSLPSEQPISSPLVAQEQVMSDSPSDAPPFELEPPTLPGIKSKADQIREVLEYWREETGRSKRCKIGHGSDRWRRVAKWLGEYRMTDLKNAIHGATIDPWYSGTAPNSSGSLLEVHNIFRNGPRIEKLANVAVQARKRREWKAEEDARTAPQTGGDGGAFLASLNLDAFGKGRAADYLPEADV